MRCGARSFQHFYDGVPRVFQSDFFFVMFRSGSRAVAANEILQSPVNRGGKNDAWIACLAVFFYPGCDRFRIRPIVCPLMFTRQKKGRYNRAKQRVPAGCSATGTAVIPISPGGREDTPQQRDNR